MATLTPTYASVQWGRFPDQVLHVVENSGDPTPGGAPCVVFRHGGGMNQYDHGLSLANTGAGNALATYLVNTRNGSSDTRFHWIAINTRQRKYTTAVTGVTQSSPVYYPGNLDEFQEAVQWVRDHSEGGAIVPEIGATLNVNPGLIFVDGHSAGALGWCCNMFRPRRLGSGGVGPRARYGSYKSDFLIRGAVLAEMPLDMRTTGDPTDQGDDWTFWQFLTGFFGTDTEADWEAWPQELKAAWSPRAYLQDTSTTGWVPSYIVYEDVGTGVKPYGSGGGDPHDGAQKAELEALLDARNLTYASELIDTTTYPTGWNDATFGPQLSERVYDFLVDLL